MKILQALAQATIETARTIPKKDLPALADAVLRLLHQHALSSKHRLFLHILRRMLVKENTTIPLTLTTPSGSAGKHSESIASFVHLAIGKPVDLQESADTSLIGGCLLVECDERFDASLRGSITLLGKHLSSPLPYDAR
ncbi:F0F1 ATP synthase subunit delta [Candidatus Peregrinibacteria bacterium]|nr:F0F1 ATP synthase subunit delta [Candidatus Peregrinibacteria bacterium]MBI4129363.1 F0F1 ATP synthase subunit delta [Candidatus Peregrinibacteria bacterium]